jgi:hypothetical protein
LEEEIERQEYFMSELSRHFEGSFKRSDHGNGSAHAKEGDALENQVVKFAMGGKLAKVSRDAVRRQVKKGFAVTFKRGNKVIKQFPDGREEILGTIKKLDFQLPTNVPLIGKK